MYITTCTPEDLSQIKELYKAATELQAQKGVVQWPEFSDEMILQDIEENQLLKIMQENVLSAIFTLTFNDLLIWGDKGNDPAVYIHRIATNPKCRGQNLVKNIITWTKQYALDKGLKYIRLDTVGENQGLIKHYTNCGFTYLGIFNLPNVQDLPAHYAKGGCCLFEMEVNSH